MTITSRPAHPADLHAARYPPGILPVSSRYPVSATRPTVSTGVHGDPRSSYAATGVRVDGIAPRNDRPRRVDSSTTPRLPSNSMLRSGPAPRTQQQAFSAAAFNTSRPRTYARSRSPQRHVLYARACGACFAFVLSVTGACANGPNLSTDYGQTARENYELAVAEFADRDWEEATTFADFVRVRFPFSRYAVESELLIARADFELGNYATSNDAFKQFAKLHPTHQHVRNGWVAYMASVSAYMGAPEDFFFLLPRHYQRDQSQLRVALQDLGYFFDHYPDSPMAAHAAKLRDDVQHKLLEHELYVAEFYLERDRPHAAIGRLEAAHKRYVGAGFDADILFMLGLTYLRMDEIELARNTFSELQTQHPAHHHGKQARIYLNHIYKVYGPADPHRTRPEYEPPTPKSPPRPKNAAARGSSPTPAATPTHR